MSPEEEQRYKDHHIKEIHYNGILNNPMMAGALTALL